MKRVVASLALALVAISATAGETKVTKKPVQVFLLSGQSNMTGRGTLGDLNKPAEDQMATLVRFIKAPENVEKYKGLYSGANKTRDGWTIRDDVFIIAGAGAETAHGGLKPGYGGFRNKGFGPELGIGHVLGDRYEEPILLVKVAFGACNLAVDFRPPSSGGQVGGKYSLVVEALRGAIKRLPELVPGYTNEQGYKIAGFFWNQGEHDSSDKFAPEYEKNLANLIVDLRKEFDAPNMKAVVAVTGAGGWDSADKWRKMVQDAQLAIAKRPEFKGSVATTETRDFYRPQEKFGGNNQGIHWHANGESYWLMGEAMGRDMVKLLDGKAGTKAESAATPVSVKQMQDDFLNLKFGMFIHFNMETYKAVQWVAGYHSPADFNPGGPIDTDAWADAAKSAGMKYAVLTAKHVSGFCLWDSKYTTYDVMHPDCPYKQDLVAQFIRSFKSRGLKVGLYYCWRNPGFGDPGKYKVLPPECDPARHTPKEQIEFQKKQIAELIEKYPDVFYIWNDGLDPQIMPAEEALAFFRSLRPGILASSNWWDWGKKGTPYADIAVKEMRHFPESNAAPGETCWCLEQKWFWQEGARPKTAKQVVDLLNTVHGRNSNFLLNVGPDRHGKFEEASVKVLAEVGKLLDSRATP